MPDHVDLVLFLFRRELSLYANKNKKES